MTSKKASPIQDNGQMVAQVPWHDEELAAYSITTIRITRKPPSITHSEAAILAAVITFFAAFLALVYVVSFT